MNKYHMHVTGSDNIGFNFLQNIISLANQGAVMKPDTLPHVTRWPHSCSMVIESETPPTPSAGIRVFEDGTNKEIFAVFVETESADFSMDTVDSDASTNNGTPWTKEQLDAMEWEVEFKKVMADAGIGGRQRNTMTNAYLKKYAESITPVEVEQKEVEE